MAEPRLPPSPERAASWQVLLQRLRLAQIQGVSQAEVQTLMGAMAGAQRLPRLGYHFQRHGHEFEAETEAAYERLFLDHIRRDLRRFTFLTRVGQNRMWYLVDEHSGAVALYNETRRRYWSYLCNRDVPRLLAGTRGSWVELVQGYGRWVVELW